MLKYTLLIVLGLCCKDLFSQVSIVGTATPAMDWTTDQTMTQVPGNDGLFRIDLYLHIGGVKFRKDMSWDVNWGGTAWPFGTAMLFGDTIDVPQSGYYSITLDTILLQYSFSSGRVGINTLDPQSNLDVAGSFNHRSVTVLVNETNTALIPSNSSYVIISGSATSIIYAILPYSVADGRRLIIQNTSNFPVQAEGTLIDQGKIVEYIYSVDSGWSLLTPYVPPVSFDNWSIYGNSFTSPSLNYIGTTDNNDLSIRTNSISRMTIKSNGQLGIATENPSGVLQINGKATSTFPTINLVDTTLNNIGGAVLQFTNLTGSQKLKIKSSIGAASNGTDTYFDFFRNSNTLMSLRGDGNLGLGSLDPGSRLTVQANASNVLSLERGEALAENLAASIYFGGGNYRTGIISTIGTSSTQARMGFFTGYSFNGGPSFLLERLSITNAGKIGIGTIEPLEKLDIDGNACIRDNYYFELGKGLTKEVNAGKIGYGLFGDASSLSIVGAGTSAGNRKIRLWAEGGTTFEGGANFGGFVKMDNNLGVGTAIVPSGYKVAVDGKIIAEELRIQNSTAWPDYVFEKEYDLMPLEEVATHIQTHKHLPGVPSSVDIDKNGIIVGEMQSVLLKKIEELTLYIMELKKEVDELKTKQHEKE